MRASEGRGLRAAVAREIYTCFAFWIAVSTLPALALSYIVVRICKHLWLKLLSSRYPHLKFIKTDTVRSLLDTHRNQGIINVLLNVKGELNAEEIKSKLYQHVVERRDRDGRFAFPRLRHLLVSCWGNYAWDENGPFNPDNHFIVSNGVFRCRPVSEINIQDYVSDIVSKYFPPDQPPWQYIIIPCQSPEPNYYILVRVHHLLLTGKNSINIGDLLLVEQSKTSELLAAHSEYTQQSPLTKLFPTPSAIPEFVEKISEVLSNTWNEFVSEYDPVESPRALKTMPGAFHVAGLLLLSTVNAMREVMKKHAGGKEREAEPFTATSLIRAVRRECDRRELTWTKTVLSPLVTIDPRKWPRTAFSLTRSFIRTLISLPSRTRDEIIAIRELRASGHVRSPGSLTWRYSSLARLGARAAREAAAAAGGVYRAPARLWTDTVLEDDGRRHVLQTVSLCGRKVTAWSKPISRSSIEHVARALGVSSTDIALYAATESIRTYFQQTNNTIPDVVLATARAATEDFLFTFSEGDGRRYKKTQTGGMVCVSLPLGATPRRTARVLGRAARRQGALAAAWTAQANHGALTRAVPSPVARLALNMLSRKFAVSYTEINSPIGARQRKMLWGQVLESIVYWRPPQANISLSLTVIQYADTVRLAVMTDARLSPSHNIPATRWPNTIQTLIEKVDTEIARIARNDLPQIVTTEVPVTRSEEDIDEAGEGSSAQSTLKPPTVEVASPPMTRKQLA